MKLKVSVIFTALILMMAITANSIEASLINKAKITVKVIDEFGNAVEKANVRIGFEINTRNGPKYNNFEGSTKSDGIFYGSASCNSHVGFTISKPGYYESDGTYDFINKSAFRWEPWNPEIKVVLRNIENPIPMYARDTRKSSIEIPVLGKDVGFDLIEFDWVKPYGLGSHADLIYNLKVLDNGGDDFEYQLDVKFANKYDGIQASEETNTNMSMLLLPKNAPVDGYKKKLGVFLKGVKRGAKYSWEKNRNYIFRVRSEVENGKLKKAMYGKILADIALAQPSKNGGFPIIQFKYYLNPDYTRNLEFDPNRNLFLNLPVREQVR